MLAVIEFSTKLANNVLLTPYYRSHTWFYRADQIPLSYAAPPPYTGNGWITSQFRFGDRYGEYIPSKIRAVAMEAWMLKHMGVEDYKYIRAVRSVRESTPLRGRVLRQEVIRYLFYVYEADLSSKGPRDAALLAIIIGCC